MITKLHIENFKSLSMFDLTVPGEDLKPFTCLIGLNGAGKSTLLQAFDFIAHIAIGTTEAWLKERNWKKTDLLCKLGTRRSVIIRFVVGLRTPEGDDVEWDATFNTTHLKCTAETITQGNDVLLSMKEGRLSVLGQQKSERIPFEFQGSILSSLKLAGTPPNIEKVKVALAGLKSLELLSPDAMRRRAREAEDIGTRGEMLSAFLHKLNKEQREQLTAQIREFYPQFTSFDINTLLYGWKNLRVWETYTSQEINAFHINDGMLRILAILAQAQTSHTFLLFDEIENGITPAVIHKLVTVLLRLSDQGKQILVTTHSPLILNYLADDIARESVILVYRETTGDTKACRYFSQEETSRKLGMLGPGEVFVDTNLEKLVERIRERPPTDTTTQ